MATCYDNLLLATDSYKVSHHLQYPPKTQFVYSYFESRGGEFEETVFFGLQYIIKKWLVGQVITAEKIHQAKELWQLHFGNNKIFNEKGWLHILEKHGGKLPIEIKAVPEGTVLPTKNVLFTVENTDPECPWLTGWLETLLVQTWYPTTVATNSREHKKIIKRYLEETADSTSGILFKLHDFGCRGVTAMEAAAIGGMAHLVNFSGTDTFPAVCCARQYYNARMPGTSIPASEHSTMTAWGKSAEVDAMGNMLNQFPTGLMACVSDSFNIWEACRDKWGNTLRDRVKKRDGVLVVRPDSGDPPSVVVKCLELLGEAFGTTLNKKGYKMLPDYLRLIQGDGISLVSLERILLHMKENGWSAENVAFGSGGSLLQKLNRDTLKFACKCSSVVVDGKHREIFKDPVTDHEKTSRKGRLTLELNEEGHYVTKERGEGDLTKDLLQTVFKNGQLMKDTSFAEVREHAAI
eukprot:gene4810-106_t